MGWVGLGALGASETRVDAAATAAAGPEVREREAATRGEKRRVALGYARQRSAHKASNVYNVEELPRELLRPAWRLPLNFSSFARLPLFLSSIFSVFLLR